MKPLCIYHGEDCDDGFAAAWCVRHAVGPDVFEFHPGVHQQKPPDVSDRRVLLVDFSYKRPVLLEMAAKARSVVILDHHKTAMDDLAGFREPAPFAQWADYADPFIEGDGEPIAALFDMNRSGAGIAWDFFHCGEPRPRFIDYIEDRDLWRNQLPGVAEFTVALRSHPREFDTWDHLVETGPDAAIAEGRVIQRYFRQRVDELKRSAYMATIAGVPCLISNTPKFAGTEVAGELAERALFGACYFEVEKGRWRYSLRSRSDFDVSEIAKKFGGGGHAQAAGFTVDAPVHHSLSAADDGHG
jgi:uncharacterized protein